MGKPKQSPEKSAVNPVPNSNGGKRVGAGRKPKELTKLRADFHTATYNTIGEWLPELLGNMKRLADGMKVKAKAKESDSDDDDSDDDDDAFYFIPPDRQANEYLINRLLGKPIEKTEVSGKDGAAMEHTVIVLPANNRKDDA